MNQKSTTKSAGISARTWIGIAVAVLAVVFILQNRATVTIQFLTVSIASPQWLTMGIVFAMGLLSGWLVSRRRG